MNSYRCHTQLYAMLWRYLSSYSKLVYLCVWILFMWYLKMKVSCMVVFGMKELLNLLQSETGPISWPGRSCEFTLLDSVSWKYVTEHIYIGPFGILLMERHTEIEHVLRPALFWDCTQRNMVIPFQCFGITSQSHLQGSRCPRRTCLDSRQPAHTGCLLEELTVNPSAWGHLNPSSYCDVRRFFLQGI